MSHFEYIMVMVSIILGLGITLALRGFSRLIRSPHREPVVLMWAVFFVLLYLQTWWALWDLSAVEDWTIIKFLFAATYVCTMYAMTELMLPMTASSDTDWLAHFKSVRKWFFGMIIVLGCLAILLNWFLAGVPLWHPYRLVQLSIVTMAIIGWLTPSMSVQRWIAGLFFVALFGGQLMFRLWPGLQG